MSARNRPENKANRRHDRTTRDAAKRRRPPMPWFDPIEGEPVGIATACAITATSSDEDVEDAKRWTHDNLALLLADNRRSRLEWFIYRGDEVEEAIAEYFENTVDAPDEQLPVTPDTLETKADFLGWAKLRPGAVFVVAVAKTSAPVDGCEL